MSGYRAANALDKNSRGYGSEYHMRELNRELLHNKFQGESGYLYLLDFPGSIKVGFSKDWERRTTQQILGGRTVMIIAGPTNELADLEFDTLTEFKKWTRLNPEGTRYTEFLDRASREPVRKFLTSRVKADRKLKFIINNP